MSKKRGSGEGSIYKRKDGKWVAAATVHLGSGKAKKKYFYANTRKECAIWLNKMLETIRLGAISNNSDAPLIEWLRTWLRDYCVNVRDSTRMNYSTYIERHIALNKIADIPLNRLTTADLQAFSKYLCESGRLDGNGGLNAKTIRNLFNMLHKALNQAIGNQLILSNPSDYVVLPQVKKPSVSFLNIDEQNALLKACMGERWRIGIIISLGTGLRIGELLALRRSSIKFDEGISYLDINKSLQRVTDFNNATKGKHKTILRESETKTDNSNRKIPLTPDLVDALNDYFAYQDNIEARSNPAYINDPYIICNADGNYIDPSTYRNWFKEIVKKAGLEGKITPHTLRHTFASTALKYGMDLKNISNLLGHYSTDFTARTYVHTDLEGQYIAMLKMSQNITIQKKEFNYEEFY